MPDTAAQLSPPAPPTTTRTGAAGASPQPRNNVKETVTSLVIAFALAFVFRGFVVEAFLIPTGSMAPTLNGAHALLRNDKTGYTWAMGPRMVDMGPDMETPRPIIGGSKHADLMVHDPILRRDLGLSTGERTRAGDRIFVMKYLYSVFDPARYDIVVFKNPTEPQMNFIKRLIGLPGDQLALIDGDVWVRTPQPNDPRVPNTWMLPGWRVATKPELAQRSMWQTVFDSQFTPVVPLDGRVYDGPWRVPTEFNGQWDVAGKQDYRFTGPGPTHLKWDDNRPIKDYYAYNDQGGANDRFNVGDLCLSMGVRPDEAGMTVGLVVRARRHEFKAEFSGSTVSLKMRAAPSGPSVAGEAPAEEPWRTLETTTLKEPLKAGVVTDVEFWHVDQTLQVFVGGERVASASYEWSPAERLAAATNLGSTWAEQLAANPGILQVPSTYQSSGARLEFDGGPVTISRVALKRDIYYQPATYQHEKVVAGVRSVHSKGGQPALATAPQSVLTLGPDEFFCCGDNSPASHDGRLWDTPDPWVEVIDPSAGIVPRDLLIGKAFFVYFPAPNWRGVVPIPDFGRMRFIW